MPPGDIHGSRPCAVTPLDPELIQAGNAVGSGRSGATWPRPFRRSAVPPFHNRIHSRRLDCGLVIGMHRSGAGLRFLSRD
jgi:hypothetical protein